MLPQQTLGTGEEAIRDSWPKMKCPTLPEQRRMGHLEKQAALPAAHQYRCVEVSEELLLVVEDDVVLFFAFGAFAAVGRRPALSIRSDNHVHGHRHRAAFLYADDVVSGRMAFDRDGVAVRITGDRSVGAVELGRERPVYRVAGTIHAFGRIGFGIVIDGDGYGTALRRGSGIVFRLCEVDFPNSGRGFIGSARRCHRDSGEQEHRR